MNHRLPSALRFLAELSLDRSAGIAGLLGFPAGGRDALRRAVDAALAPAAGGADDARPGQAAGRLCDALDADSDPGAGAVRRWIDAFLAAAGHEDAASNYWSRAFDDLFAGDAVAAAPPGVGADAWQALAAAWRGEPPPGGATAPWAGALRAAARPRARLRERLAAATAAYAAPLAARDLRVCERLGADGAATWPGATGSPEAAATAAATRAFWGATAAHFPARAVEALAHQRDLAAWQAVADPAGLAGDVMRHGRTVEQVAAEVFGRPGPPPPLAALLEQGPAADDRAAE